MGRSFKDIPKVRENVVVSNNDIANRITDLRTDNINIGESVSFSNISLSDIDDSVRYHLQEHLKLSVTENSEIVPVPVIYGSPERWKSMRQDGYYRDGKSKLVLPLVMFRRTGFQLNKNLNVPRLYNDRYHVVRSKKWDSKHKYTSIQNKIRTENEDEGKYIAISVPTYIEVSYEAMVWTSYVEQMNSLVEKLSYFHNSYWGDPDKYQFKFEVESFDNSIDVSAGTERMIRSSFNASAVGFILPNNVAGKDTSRIMLSPTKISFKEEIIL